VSACDNGEIETPVTRHAAAALDLEDPLAPLRARFHLPEDLIYLDGNSLGALPVGVPEVMRRAVEYEWGERLIRSWNERWFGASDRISRRLAPILGAAPDEIQVADSTSINLFKLIAAGVRLRPGRREVLVDASAFPTNLYLSDGVSEWLCERPRIVRQPVEKFGAALGPEVAVVVLSHVDYRLGTLHELPCLVEAARRAGSLVLVDLSHSAGVMPLDLHACGIDLAVGCGYKFLCGGPGAPAYAYVHRQHQARLEQPLCGWFGHARPFEFEARFEPSPGITRLQCGTPPVLSLLALETALGVFDGVDLNQVREKSERLGELMIQSVLESCSELGVELASPSESARRGSQISFRHRHAYPVMRALIEAGVVGDFRAPDILRFGLAPLYTRFVDAWDAADRLREVLATRAWKRFPERPDQPVT